MQIMTSIRTMAVLAFLSLPFVSCSSSEALHPVEGTVLLNGEPLGGAVVAFHPEGNADVRVEYPIGSTKLDGTFTLTTGQKPGARAGKYLVTIMCPVSAKTKGGGMSMASQFDTEDRLSGAYSDLSKSQLRAEIKPGPNQLEPFKLK